VSEKYQTYPELRRVNDEWLPLGLPKNWVLKRVKFLLKDGQEGIKIGPFGSALKLEDMVESGYRVYGQENIIKRDFSIGKRLISTSKFTEMSVYAVRAGDILVTMMGTSGKCQLVPETAEFGIIDSHLLRLRPNEKEVVPDFLCMLLDECHELKYQIGKQGKGSIMHGLNSSIVKNLFLPLPSLEEQLVILSFLDHETAKIDTLIEKQQQLIKLLKEKRQAVISHAVTKGLNPDAPMKDSGVEWLGEVPEHWSVVPLRHITPEVTVGIVVTPAKYYVDNGIPCFRSLNVKENSIEERDFVYISKASNSDLIKSQVFQGDILVVRSGQPGKAAVVLAKHDGYNCIDLIIIRKSKKIISDFLCYQINSDVCKKQISSGSGGAIQQHFNVELAKGLYVTFPPLEEQMEISKYIMKQIQAFDSLVKKAEMSIDLMKERRSALISAAVTGKIDVRNWKPQTSADMQQKTITEPVATH